MTMTPPQRQAGYQSRDLSDSAAYAVGTLPREQRTQAAPGHTIPHRVRHPRQLQPQAPKPKQKRRFQHQAGSQQILSIRGRRVLQQRIDPATVTFMVLATFAVVAGLVLTMFVTGITTQQSFRIQNLREQNTVLNNQLETLNRDLADVSSTSNLAQQAATLGMVLPVQAGILSVDAEGNVVEQRAASAETQPLVDVNSLAAAANAASAEETAEAAAQDDAASEVAAVDAAASGDEAAAEVPSEQMVNANTPIADTDADNRIAAAAAALQYALNDSTNAVVNEVSQDSSAADADVASVQ